MLRTPISVVSCSVINTVILESAIDGATLIYLGWTLGNPSLLCVLGSHLLINLKEAGELGLNEGTNYRPGFLSQSVSDMEFAEGNTESKISSSSLWVARTDRSGVQDQRAMFRAHTSSSRLRISNCYAVLLLSPSFSSH